MAKPSKRLVRRPREGAPALFSVEELSSFLRLLSRDNSKHRFVI